MITHLNPFVPSRAGATNRPGLFLLVQLLLVVAAGVVIAHRVREVSSESTLPPLREAPLELEFGYDDDKVISDEQLRSVLTKLTPRFKGKPAKINYIDHALRFWGAEATFPTIPDALSGEEMRLLLTDHAVFKAALGDTAEPLLVAADDGVRVRVQEGLTSSSHVDHTMATLAEVGTPLAFLIRTPNSEATFGDLVHQSLVDFSVNQREYEWSVLTYALLVQPTDSWRTSEGQRIDFDLLAERIMREDMPDGVCFGNHRLYTLALLLRVDELEGEQPILSPAGRQAVIDYLQQMTARLVAHQHYSGFWNADWPTKKPSSAEPTSSEGDGLGERILATGHTLEWWAIAPEDVHPPRGVVRTAGQWLTSTIEKLDEEQVTENYTYLTHAGRALALWRDREPADVPLLAVETNGGAPE